MTIEQESLWCPPNGEIIVVQLDVPTLHGKKAVQWMVRLTEQTFMTKAAEGIMLDSVTLTGNIEHAKFASGLTAQAERQRDSINRLLTHLTKHCPGLNGVGSCQHLRAES